VTREGMKEARTVEIVWQGLKAAELDLLDNDIEVSRATDI
jgi:hypothetical protein